MLQPRRIAALTAAATLAFPAGALAQGAGETQYSDPFQGQGGSGSSGSSGSGSGSSSGSTGTGSGSGSGSTGSGSQLSNTPPGSSETTAAQTRTPRGQLPRTGAEPGLLALLGAGFILTGAGLRVRVRRPLA
jgi:LPXTG-motif cell wall-anchored protein